MQPNRLQRPGGSLDRPEMAPRVVPVVRISVVVLFLLSVLGTLAHADEARSTADNAAFEIQTLAGRVIWYGEGLRRRLGIGVVPEAIERVLAIETDDGQLIPLIEDLRTRAFRQDERLRAMHAQLRVRRYRATPAVQILGVFELTKEGTFEVDYWCDVCAIPMYETGRCACCQGENRLRRRKVEN